MIDDHGAVDNDMLSNLQHIAMRSNGTGLKLMDPAECARNYSSEFNPQWGSVVLALDVAEVRDYSVYNAFDYHAANHGVVTNICQTMNMDSICLMTDVINNVTNKAPWNLPVMDPDGQFGSYHAVTECYAEELTQHCKVTFDLPLLVIVVICNTLKAVAFIMILALPSFKPLITVGDAICSLLKDPDPETDDVGLGRSETLVDKKRIPYSTAPWKYHRCHWFCGASSWQWTVWILV